MSLAAHVKNLRDHFQEIVEAAVLEDGEHRRQLLAREAVRLADLVLLDNDEGLPRGQRKARFLGNDSGGTRHGVQRAPAFTMAGPPVAIVRSQIDISSWASGILGRSRHRIRSSGAPCFLSAVRSTRVISSAVFRLIGCGEKMTASLHFIALMAMLTIVT